MIGLRIDRYALICAALASGCLHVAVAILGLFMSGYVGAPVPYGDSGGFDLIFGFYAFVLPVFLLDIALTAIPLYLFIRPSPSGRSGVGVALVLLAVVLACGPLLQIVWTGSAMDTNWLETAIDAALAWLVAGWLFLVGRTRFTT